ncbi:MAG TPA: hypothetical protein DCS29_02070 [Candidatus Magasanikbacteria bacterium]|nr:MAG: hypothetical protein A2479_00390 [Candidatus Magasanikbacteria bacterium RIFOXYC2_FULL_39_8]HAT03542.1 hypothetical protein [Candidatus Magasanikbacteria bacterium]
MKHIILFNPSKKVTRNVHNFIYRFCKETNIKHIKTYPVYLEDTIIILDKKNCISLIQNNKNVPLTNSIFFTRIHGKYSYFLSLIYDIAHARGIQTEDAINRYHIKSDKPTQAIKLSQAGLPYPSSVICTHVSFEKNKKTIYKHIAFPLVLKAKGGRGNAVWKINNKKELKNKLYSIKDIIILQTYIPNKADLRILVYKNNIIGAIERTSKDGFYNNLSKGGSAKQVTLTNEEKKTAKKAAKILEIDLAGVDIIRSAKGPFIIEVNKSPMIKGFEATTGIDVIKYITNNITKNQR